MKKLTRIIITIASLCLLALSFIFQCPKKEDGSYMHCHNANMTIAVIACVIIVSSILLFLLKNILAKQIISGIIALLSVICALIPGILFYLCMMPEMTCRAALRPADIICSIVIFLFAIVGLLFEKKERI
jgi:hypothetical protein